MSRHNLLSREKIMESWIDIKQAAKYLSVSKDWIYHNQESLDIPRGRIGKMYRYRISDLDNWVKKNYAQNN